MEDENPIDLTAKINRYRMSLQALALDTQYKHDYAVHIQAMEKLMVEAEKALESKTMCDTERSKMISLLDEIYLMRDEIVKKYQLFKHENG
jgi:hypothetical protein